MRRPSALRWNGGLKDGHQIRSQTSVPAQAIPAILDRATRSSGETATIQTAMTSLSMVREQLKLYGGPVYPERAGSFPQLRYMGSKYRLLPWIHACPVLPRV